MCIRDSLNAKVQAADDAIKAKQRENAQLQPTQQELDDEMCIRDSCK